MQNWNNFQIPNQATFDSSTDTYLTKIQVVQDRLYNASNKVAHKDEWSAAEETNPTYTYTLGNLTRVDYTSGNYKLLTYDLNTNLTQVDFVKGAVTYRKVFTYDVDFNLTAITFSTL